MIERDFHAEAVEIVAGVIEKRRPDAAAWETAYYTLIRATLRECERRLRAEALIRQMVEMVSKGYGNFSGWLKAAEKYLEGK